tara:strand:+ start:324 stop:782 length:459 start_codon:yes stop_codon:yes gene_type:complete
MQNKYIIIIFLIISLSGCGYSPIYYNQNTNFNITELNFEGENIINNFLEINLKRYKGRKQDRNYNISTKTKYEKNIYSKDKAGNATQFELVVETKFKIFKTNIFLKNLIIKDKFIMKNFDDKFEESEYEKNIKQNFAGSIANKLITELSNLK